MTLIRRLATLDNTIRDRGFRGSVESPSLERRRYYKPRYYAHVVSTPEIEYWIIEREYIRGAREG